MKVEVKVPSVGESVTTADIESWEKASGDLVKKGDLLVILETDKASMEVPAVQDGQLEILKQKGTSVSVDEVIAYIQTDVSSNVATSQTQVGSQTESQKASQYKKNLNDTKKLEDSFEKLSPAVRNLVALNKLNPSEISGSGKGERLTKEDILKALEHNESSTIKKDSSQQNQDLLQKNQQNPTQITSQQPLKPGQNREAMSRLRRVTAERLVQSQHNTATLSTFNEADLSRIIDIRKNYQQDFVKKYGFKLGFMSFFVKSVVVALKEYPKINSFIDGNSLIYNTSQNIGIAVSTKKGLVVPVLFQAENLSLAQIEQKIIEYRDKALSRKLSPDDLLGGTFTISNGGVFGSLLSTPILNPPQSGILGMHKIQERAVVINGKIVIRPMMYLTLSYDHRIVDGRESVGFLVKVREGLEEPSRLLIDL